MRDAIEEALELAGILLRLVVVFTIIGLTFAVPIGLLVFVIRIALGF